MVHCEVVQSKVMGDFPASPVVKNLSRNAGDAGLIPGWGTKISHAAEQLTQVPQLSPDAGKNNNNNKLMGSRAWGSF